jgi:hypothetical protein
MGHGEVRNGRISWKTQIQMTSSGSELQNNPKDREHSIPDTEEQGKVLIISIIIFTYI